MKSINNIQKVVLTERLFRFPDLKCMRSDNVELTLGGIKAYRTFNGIKKHADAIKVEIDEAVMKKFFSELYDFVRNATKTYAEFAPHEYYVKDKLDELGKEEFVWLVGFIRDYGFECKFGKQLHIYYELDGHYYWTMGDPVEETIILNRCSISDYDIVEDSMVYNKKKVYI